MFVGQRRSIFSRRTPEKALTQAFTQDVQTAFTQDVQTAFTQGVHVGYVQKK